LQRGNFEVVLEQDLFDGARQITELRAIPPEEIEIPRRAMLQVDADQSATTAQNERRLDARERFQHALLKRVELTAGRIHAPPTRRATRSRTRESVRGSA
jgi:hypothetical protein